MLLLLRKYHYMPIASKAAVWFFICTLLQNALQFITVPIFTRIMPTGQYGLYNLYQAWSGILAVFCTMGMETGAFVNGLVKIEDERGKNVMSVNLLSITSTFTIILFGTCLLLYPFVGKLMNIPVSFILLMFVGTLMSPPLQMWNMLQRFTYQYKRLVAVTLALVFTQVLGGIYFVSYAAEYDKAFQRILWHVLPPFIIGTIFYASFVYKAKVFYTIKKWKRTLSLQMPLVFSNLSMVLLLSSNRIIINMYEGTKEVAIFSIAFSIGQIISVIKQSIVNAFHPYIYERLKTRNFEEIEKLLYNVMLFLVGIALAASCLAPLVVRMFAPISYYDAVYVVPFVAGGVVFTLISQVMNIIGTYYERTKYFIHASGISCIVNILLNLALIPVCGYKIAGFVSLISYMVLAYINYYFVIKNRHFDNPFTKRTVFVIPVISATIVSCVSFLYSYLVFLYVVSFVLFVLGIIKRKDICSLIKK